MKFLDGKGDTETSTHILVECSDGFQYFVKKSNRVRPSPHHMWTYHRVYGERLADLIAQGWTLKEACSIENGLPTTRVVRQWLETNDAFRELYQRAKQFQADLHADGVLRLAKRAETADKDDVPGIKLASENLKWLAGVRRPSEYANTTKITGDPTAPLQFIIDTGIRRVGDSGFEQPAELDTAPQPSDEIQDAEFSELPPNPVGDPDLPASDPEDADESEPLSSDRAESILSEPIEAPEDDEWLSP